MAKHHKHSYCPSCMAGFLDNKLRRHFFNPNTILKPYINKNMTALDIGCGPGVYSIEIAKLLEGTGKVIAADVQEGMLEVVRKKIVGTALEHSIELHKSDFECIGVVEKVDFVLAFWMVHEVRNQKKFFEELRSIIKPNGLILIIEPKVHVSNREFNAMVDLIKEIGFAIVETPKVFFSRTVVIKKVQN